MRTEHVMGMPVTFDVRGHPAADEAIDAAYDWLRWVDRTFSTYRPDSEIARLNDGRLSEEEADPLVRAVLGACRELHTRTGGAFDIEAAARSGDAPARPGAGHGRAGAVEPAGYVKGWALARAWDILAAAGIRNALLDAGGDLIVRGTPEDGQLWRVGIQHPVKMDKVAAVLELSQMGVATSGLYRRGEHIVDPATGRAPRGVLSVSCIGRDLATADALATAAFAMGRDAAPWLDEQQGDVDSMVIHDDDTVLMTPGFAALRAPAR
jgi:thiamine biosynthesis lipoprotein